MANLDSVFVAELVTFFYVESEIPTKAVVRWRRKPDNTASPLTNSLQPSWRQCVFSTHPFSSSRKRQFSLTSFQLAQSALKVP